MAARRYWVLRTTGDRHLAAAELREAVHAVDPDVAASTVRTLAEILSIALGSLRINVRLLEFFGEIAILLAGFGTYAIVVFAASTRRRELAIRTACGAGHRALVWLLRRSELPALLGGLAVGLVAAAMAARSLDDLLFATAPLEPMVYGSVALLLAIAVLGATYLPARRVANDRPAEIART
jgi:putative ABC transport system permease protein